MTDNSNESSDWYTPGGGTVYTTAAGAGGYIVTGGGGGISSITNGSNGYYWQDSNSSDLLVSTNYSSKTMQVRGDAEITGNLTVGGVNLMEALSKIESRLNILRPNAEIESRWEELKELGDKYRALEADILSKEELLDLLTRD